MDRPLSEILVSARNGSAADIEQLGTTVYRQLHAIARGLGQNSGNATMSATALVSEAWLRLASGSRTSPIDRRAFGAYAAKVMRSVLIDYARHKRAVKRGGGSSLPSGHADLLIAQDDDSFDVLDLDAALVALAEWDSRAAQLVELRFFGGLSEEDAAAELGISVATASRDWRIARAWLRRHLAGEAGA
ncbi:MAG: sigma-70 family RNA polymerase sigma factor [Planctomycetes bacterium]|nr:sigma-70 family RNA polymerase sigma factor [Planctomycetota bacterium]